MKVTGIVIPIPNHFQLLFLYILAKVTGGNKFEGQFEVLQTQTGQFFIESFIV